MEQGANNRSRISKSAHKRIPPTVTIILFSIVAFVLGAILFSGGSSNNDSSTADELAESASSTSTTWTCSMHPQIKLPKPGKCPICFMDLIPLEQGIGEDSGPRQLRMTETSKHLARIESTPVTRAFAEREVRLVGKLDYDETRLAHITARFPGRLDKLYANYTGVRVNEGDHLAEIYSPELYSAQEELIMSLRYLKGLSRSSSTSLKQTAASTVDAAREKLRLWGLKDEQIKELEESGKVSDVMTIYAPTGGVVVEMGVREGMYVNTGSRIYSIAEFSHLWVKLEAYESDISWITYAQHLEFTTTSFPGEKFDAIISFIDPVVDPKTRTVKVRAVVQNRDGKLKPDMFVSAVIKSQLNNQGKVVNESLAGKWIGPMHPEIVKNGPGKCNICGMDLVPAESLGYAPKGIDAEKAPLLIPASAPLITGKRAVVYVEIPNAEGPLFEGREVELGPRAGDFYIVKSGLEEGELVVTNGAFKIDSELQIQAKPSMMLPQGGVATSQHNHSDMKEMQPDKETPAASEAPAADYKAGTAERLSDCEEAQTALIPVYTTYFDVQMSLAGDDFDNVNSAFKKLKSDVQNVDMGLFKNEAHMRWMKISNQLLSSIDQGMKAADIKESRKAFYLLSNSMIELHDTFGHSQEQSYYLTFCPMANNNKGAYWLQTVDTVYNSFYGAAMLRCGEIKQELSSTQKDASDGE
jgi:Cu(I)/Ag(I) efflux system membrane fusion protein